MALWLTHIVVGTPWFITHTDSVGCLLRLPRWVSKKNTKRKQQQQTTRKIILIHQTNSTETWGRGADGECWRDCCPSNRASKQGDRCQAGDYVLLYRLMVNSGFTMHSPMLHSFRSGVSLQVIVNTIYSSGHAVIGFVCSGTV